MVTIELSVYDAVAHFNIAWQAASDLLKNMGIDPRPGEFCHTEPRKADNLIRLHKAQVHFKEGKENITSP